MTILVEQSHSKGQHDRLHGSMAGSGGTLLGSNGVGLCAGVIAGRHFKLGCASLVVPAPTQFDQHYTTEEESKKRSLRLSAIMTRAS